MAPGALATLNERTNNQYFSLASRAAKVPVSSRNSYLHGKGSQQMASKRPTTARAQSTSMSAVMADPFDNLPSDVSPDYEGAQSTFRPAFLGSSAGHSRMHQQKNEFPSLDSLMRDIK